MEPWLPNSAKDDKPFAKRRLMAQEFSPRLTWKQTADLIIKYFPTGARLTAAVICELESLRYPTIIGDVGAMGMTPLSTSNIIWDCSAGLFQIRGFRDERGRNTGRDVKVLMDVDRNVFEAAKIVQETGWKHWSSASKLVNGSTKLASQLSSVIKTIPSDQLERLLK